VLCYGFWSIGVTTHLAIGVGALAVICVCGVVWASRSPELLVRHSAGVHEDASHSAGAATAASAATSPAGCRLRDDSREDDEGGDANEQRFAALSGDGDVTAGGSATVACESELVVMRHRSPEFQPLLTST
jgi:hypothetical protein